MTNAINPIENPVKSMAFKHAPASARPEVSIPVVGLMNE